MSEQTSKSATSFLLGGVVVALAVVGYLLFSNTQVADQPDISVEVPGVGSIEGNVDGG